MRGPRVGLTRGFQAGILLRFCCVAWARVSASLLEVVANDAVRLSNITGSRVDSFPVRRRFAPEERRGKNEGRFAARIREGLTFSPCYEVALVALATLFFFPRGEADLSMRLLTHPCHGHRPGWGWHWGRNCNPFRHLQSRNPWPVARGSWRGQWECDHWC